MSRRMWSQASWVLPEQFYRSIGAASIGMGLLTIQSTVGLLLPIRQFFRLGTEA